MREDWVLSRNHEPPDALMAYQVFPGAIERLKIVDRLSANLLRIQDEAS